MLKQKTQEPARERVPLTVDTRLVERVAAGVLVCDPRHLAILYCNARAAAQFAAISDALPVPADALVGVRLGDLNPAFVDLPRMLATGGALPWSKDVSFGGHAFSVEIDMMEGARGQPGYVLATFQPARSERSEGAARLRQMVEDMPINVMTCVLEDFRIDYANKASLSTLRRIEKHLPITADQLIGSSIDVFHKDPGRIRRLLADPRNLPHTARIKAGPETLDLKISAIYDADGSYAGPMLTWALMTEQVAVANGVQDVVGAMSATAGRVHGASERLLTLAGESESMASTVSASAVEMSASFDEISSQLRRATDTARDTTAKAGAADTLASGLAGSVERIGAITTLIEKIASQTNLLALNATIEAARVGEAGKGFAVVAQEVKALAVQTAAATKDIREQVGAVQDTSAAAAEAVSEIAGNIGHLSEVFTAIAAGMEEQSLTNRSVSQSITGVSRACAEMREAADSVRSVAGDMSGFSDRLTHEMQSLINQR